MHEHAEPKTIIPSTGPDFMQIPLVIARNRNITPFAKLLYGRLILYAGKNGICTPSHETLAAEIGTTSRYVQTLLKELRSCNLVDWERRRTSNTYTVRNPSSYQDRNHSSVHDRNSSSDKKMSLNRGSVKDVDIDCSLPRKQASASILPKVKEFPALKHMLAQYRGRTQQPKPSDYPSSVVVAEVVHAARELGERWVMDQLKHLHDVRGLRWGTSSGPYSWAWFPKVIAQRYAEEQERYYIPDASEVWDWDGTRRVN